MERRKKDTLGRLPELLVHLERAADRLIDHRPSDEGEAQAEASGLSARHRWSGR